MKISREERTTYCYEASERIGNVDLYFEENLDAEDLLILSLHSNIRESLNQSCIRFTKDEFIHIMPELIDLYNQLLKGDYKV